MRWQHPWVMIAIATLALTLWMFALTSMPARAQEPADEGWTFLGGPTVPGGTVVALVIAPSAPQTLYALLDSVGGKRLFRSDNGALTWQQVYTFTIAVDDLDVDPANPDVVYAGADDGLFRSTDGGLTWTQVYTVGQALAVVSSTLLYAGGPIAGPDPDAGCYTGYLGVARSDDGGETWRMTPIGCAAELTVLVVSPDTAEVVYAGGSGHEGKFPFLFRSTDGGLSWTSLPLTSLGSQWVTALVIDPTRPERLFASDQAGVLRSTDGGNIWERVGREPQALPSAPHSLVIDVDGTLYAIPTHAPDGTPVYRSDDGGQTWWASVTRLARGVNALLADPLRRGTLYAGLDEYGVFQSVSGGSAWQERNAGIRSLVTVQALAVAPGDLNLLYAGAGKPRGGLFRSTDSGLSWTAVITDTPIRAVAVHPITPTIVIAGGPAGIYQKSAGQRWSLSHSQTAISDIAISPHGLEGMYAIGRAEHRGYLLHYRPSTGPWLAGSWMRQPVDDTRVVTGLVVHPYDPQWLLVGGRPLSNDSRVYHSEDGGLTWRQVLTGIPPDVTALTMDERRPRAVYVSTTFGGVYASLDEGTTWEQWGGLGANTVDNLTVDLTGRVYAATHKGIYRWDMAGGEWTAFGLQDRWVHALAVAHGLPERFFAGTDTGVWRRELSLWQAWVPLVMR